jgi:uncharacterized protein
MTLYLLITLATMALSMWASSRVTSNFVRYSQLMASSGLTGAQAAEKIMRAAGIHDVTIHSTPGALSDHYDPSHKRLVLCEENYHGYSVAAIGVAAHEAGHALQHAKAYAPLHWRMAAVGITTMAGTIIPIFSFGGFMLLGGKIGIMILAACAGVVMLFQLITLPVEFDATARAKRAVVEMGMVMPGAETEGMNKVLDAAAWTYVAAFISALGTFLYYATHLLGSSSRNDE